MGLKGIATISLPIPFDLKPPQNLKIGKPSHQDYYRGMSNIGIFVPAASYLDSCSSEVINREISTELQAYKLDPTSGHFHQLGQNLFLKQAVHLKHLCVMHWAFN